MLVDAAAVYSRSLDEKVLTLAASGWVFERLFVLCDLETESLWYDLPDSEGLTCVSGEYEGRVLPEVESRLMPWNQWRSAHPASTFLVFR